jgi:hypothetical protein
VKSIERFTESPAFRTPGTFPRDWEDDFYLTNERIRGYQDRSVYVADYTGWTFELTPPDLLPYSWLGVIPLVGGWLGSADQALFIDGGWVLRELQSDLYRSPVSENEAEMGDLFYSAGVSILFPHLFGGRQVRVDFPLYLNEPLAGEEEFDFRFSVAVILPGLMK